MKVAGNGQAKVLTPEELRLMFSEGLSRHAIAVGSVRSAIALCLLFVLSQLTVARRSWLSRQLIIKGGTLT